MIPIVNYLSYQNEHDEQEPSSYHAHYIVEKSYTF